MHYLDIFSLRVLHGYYQDGECLGLEIRPTAETADLMRKHRMTLRGGPGAVRVAISMHEDGNPFVLPAANLVLVYELVPMSGTFLGYTDYAAFGGPKPLAFSNAATTTDPAGRLMAAVANGPDAPKAGRPIGQVVIAFTSLVPLPSTPVPYVIRFAAAAATWRYCVLTRPTVADPSLEDIDGQVSFSRRDLLAAASAPTYVSLPGLGLPGSWSGSNLSGTGLDFVFNGAEIRSMGPSTVASTLYLATPQTVFDNVVWRFQLETTCSLSSTNFARIYLMSTAANPDTAGTQGYFLHLGEPNDDRLRLYRQPASGAAVDLVNTLTGTTGGVTTYATTVHIQVEVHRSAAGAWEVLAGPVGGALQPELTTTDNAVTAGGWFGMRWRYATTSRYNQFFLRQLEIRVPPPPSAGPDAYEVLGRKLAAEFPDRHPYLFESAAPVPWRATPRKGLRLRDGLETVADHLPNPAPLDNALQIIQA